MPHLPPKHCEIDAAAAIAYTTKAKDITRFQFLVVFTAPSVSLDTGVSVPFTVQHESYQIAKVYKAKAAE